MTPRRTRCTPSNPKAWRIAGVQADSGATIAESERKALRHIARAGREGADFILFPEMFLTGYHARFDADEAEAANARMARAAAEHDVNVLMGTGGKHLGVCTNQVRIFSRRGDLVGVHEKILLAGGRDRIDYEPGRGLKCFELDGLPFCVLICNDFWATPRSTSGRVPLLPQEAQDLGARAIFHAISCSGESDSRRRRILKDWHVANHRTWAMRIGIAVVSANQPHRLGSLVHCGIVGPDGEYIVRVPPRGDRFFVGELTREAGSL